MLTNLTKLTRLTNLTKFINLTRLTNLTNLTSLTKTFQLRLMLRVFPQKVPENIELSGVQANISLHMLDITSFCVILFISRHQKTDISSGTTSPLPDGMSRRTICPDRTCVPQDSTRMRCCPLCSH